MTIDVNKILEESAQLFRRHLLKCLPVAMVAVLASSAADIYWRMTGHAPLSAASPGELKLPDSPLFWLLYGFGTVVSMLLWSTVLLRLKGLRDGVQNSLAADLQAAAARWAPAMLAMLLAMALVVLGLLAFLVPGIYLAVCTAVLLPVILLEPVTPAAAVLRCYQLIRPIWVRSFACLLIAALIGLICLFVVGLVAGLLLALLRNGPVGQAAAQAAVLAAVAAFTVFASALALTLYTAASSSA